MLLIIIIIKLRVWYFLVGNFPYIHQSLIGWMFSIFFFAYRYMMCYKMFHGKRNRDREMGEFHNFLFCFVFADSEKIYFFFAIFVYSVVELLCFACLCVCFEHKKTTKNLFCTSRIISTTRKKRKERKKSQFVFIQQILMLPGRLHRHAKNINIKKSRGSEKKKKFFFPFLLNACYLLLRPDNATQSFFCCCCFFVWPF